jgi:hypothetical protein
VPYYGPCPSRSPARSCRQMVCLHGVGNRRPTRCCGGARASRWRHVRDCSCEQVVVGGEAKTPRAEWRLVVRGGDLSEKPPPTPVGDLSGKPPTGRRQDFLPVKVLTGLCSPSYAGS